MNMIRGVFRVAEDNQLIFYCPGCQQFHGVRYGPSQWNSEAPVWQWNGDYDKPTFQPSLLIRSGHYNPLAAGQDCWCTYKSRLGNDPPFHCGVCHSFIRDGQIQFLSDCTHALAGQTIPLERPPGN